MVLEKLVRLVEDVPTEEQEAAAFDMQRALGNCGFSSDVLPAANVTVARRLILFDGRLPSIPLPSHTYDISRRR